MIILLKKAEIILNPNIEPYCLSLSDDQIFGQCPLLIDVGNNIHP